VAQSLFFLYLSACRTVLRIKVDIERLNNVSTFVAGVVQDLSCQAAKGVGVDAAVRRSILQILQPFIGGDTQALEDREDSVAVEVSMVIPLDPAVYASVAQVNASQCSTQAVSLPA
jgi:hypothetical protein